MSASLLSAEQRASLADSPLFNDDLAPVRLELRWWPW
jgi:cytosine/uracil/thiamine/allantoin permease